MIEQEVQKVRKPPYQKFFELKLTKTAETNLRYFIEQELFYYNSVVEQLTSRVKAFPQDILSLKDRDSKVLETIGQHRISPEVLSKSAENCPEELKIYSSSIYDADGKCKFTKNQLGIMEIGTIEGNIHGLTRKGILSEAFSYVNGQANIILSGQKTESLKAPLQMLQTHTLDTKRHVQLNRSCIKLDYSEKFKGTMINTPYSKHAFFIEGYDITNSPFNIMVIRAPLKNAGPQKWFAELKDVSSKYLLNLTDHHPRKNRR